MAQNKEEIVVALDGSVNVAPTGAGVTLPTGATGLGTLDTEFADLGYQSTDGVSFTVTPNVVDVDAWQSATPVRKIVTARALSLSFSALQWNVNTFAAAYGGGDWTEVTAAVPGTSPGLYRYDPPADEDDLVDYAVVIDFVDGVKQYRLVVKQANVTAAADTNLARGAASVIPITFEAITPDGDNRSWYLFSNDEAVNPTP